MELDDREFCVPALHLSACLVSRSRAPDGGRAGALCRP